MNTNITIVKQEKGKSIISAINKACDLKVGVNGRKGINDVRVDMLKDVCVIDEDRYWIVEMHENPHDDSYNREVQFRIYDDCVITLERIDIF